MFRLIRRASVAGALVLCLTGPAPAGSVKSPIRRVATVQGFRVVTARVTFQGGAPALVTVQGDGDTNLGLYVYDARGRLVARDTGPTDRCRVRWTPAQTGKYTVAIVNLGGVPNRVVFRTN